MKPLIIIPALNEANKLPWVIKSIFKQKTIYDVVVVDAMSTDGTREKIKELQQKFPGLYLIDQEKRDGFGNALRIGFNFAMKGEYDPVFTMDGDGSHDPVYLSRFIDLIDSYDLIIGSRYIDGVRVEGWRFRKLLISKLASMYISYLLVKPIWDFTSGFRCYRRQFIASLNLDELHSESYIIQIQLLHLAFKTRYRVKEIPFIYKDTLDSVSKVASQNKLKTFFYVLKYSAPPLEVFRHLVYLKKEYERFVEEYDELVNPPKLRKTEGTQKTENFNVSIGVMAYNEEKIIGNCLDGLLNQKMFAGQITEIFVVSSGSTDKTNEIVKRYEEKDNRIKLIIQQKRMGKAAAINDFLKVATGDIAIIESADTVTEPQTVNELVKPFKDPQIGMSGVHPLPVNDPKKFVGFSVHKLWELHHLMALDQPKCGEMVAFRNIVPRIPKYTAVDEAAIEGMIKKEGYKLAYASKAYLRNKGPENLHDFIKQRRRIASGHKHLAVSMGHEVFTKKSSNIIRYVLKNMKWTPKEIVFTATLALVEAYSRFMGMFDFYLRDKNPFIWDISKTTKHM